MHMWGDEDVDWDGINQAADFIHDYCVKYGRLGGQSKEKFGEVRFYAQFGFSLHSLFYPGHCFYRFPKWLISFDLYVFTPLAQRLLLNKLWYKWQKHIYGRSYNLACKKFPHLEKEILCGANYPEYIPNRTKEEINGNEKITYILDRDGNKIGSWGNLYIK